MLRIIDRSILDEDKSVPQIGVKVWIYSQFSEKYCPQHLCTGDVVRLCGLTAQTKFEKQFELVMNVYHNKTDWCVFPLDKQLARVDSNSEEPAWLEPYRCEKGMKNLTTDPELINEMKDFSTEVLRECVFVEKWKHSSQQSWDKDRYIGIVTQKSASDYSYQVTLIDGTLVQIHSYQVEIPIDCYVKLEYCNLERVSADPTEI